MSCLCVAGCDLCTFEKPKKDDSWSKVMILYSAGFNSLSDDLKEDIGDLRDGFLPGEKDRNALIVVSHCTKSYSAYQYPTSPQVIRMYKDRKGNAVMDTLKTYAQDKLLTVPSVMEEILTYVRDNFKSEHYGMVLSSHGTGWLPSGYYSDPKSSSSSRTSRKSAAPRVPGGAGVPYVEEVLPGPAVKSFGQELYQPTSSTSSRVSFEMEITDMARSIPMHLDYILFDVCLMGGVEVAYELKDVCDKIGFAQTEILSEGFDYKNLALRLLSPKTPSPIDVCSDFFNYYMAQSGDYQSATISMIDCTRLDALASVCKDIFTAHRSDLAEINPSSVQRYFRFDKHWFYDMQDILAKAGMTSSESARLDQALSSCVLYKANTPKFIGIDIKVHSGLSMYLPCNGSDYLDTFYRTLAWNRATGLVE